MSSKKTKKRRHHHGHSNSKQQSDGKCFQELVLLGYSPQIALSTTNQGFDDTASALQHLKQQNQSLAFIQDPYDSLQSVSKSQSPPTTTKARHRDAGISEKHKHKHKKHKHQRQHRAPPLHQSVSVQHASYEEGDGGILSDGLVVDDSPFSVQKTRGTVLTNSNNEMQSSANMDNPYYSTSMQPTSSAAGNFTPQSETVPPPFTEHNGVRNHDDEVDECRSVSTCTHIQNLCLAMIWYSSLKQSSDKLLHYAYQSLLDDFHHILHTHLSTHTKTAPELQSEFELIYNHAQQRLRDAGVPRCRLHKCASFHRNNRDRNLDDEKEANPMLVSENNAQIQFYIDTLDTVHCLLLHSYDTGMKIHRKYLRFAPSQTVSEEHEQDEDLDAFIQLPSVSQFATGRSDDISRSRSGQLYSVHDAETKCIKAVIAKRILKHSNDWRSATHSKFFTKVSSKPKSEHHHPLSHAFGHRFYYWSVFRDSMADDDGANIGSRKSDWYIDRKYDNFKDELVNNRLFCLNMNMLQNVVTKAEKNLQSQYARQLCASDSMVCEYYRIEPYSCVSTEHITAIILYCDYYDLTHSLKSTFRKLTERESREQLKQRNREYWWWSKLLTETVALFGKRVSSLQTKAFFHGIYPQTTLSVFATYLCGPVSATPVLEVVLKASLTHRVEKGMLLEWTAQHEFSSLRAFDCSWLSCYAHECEWLFFGASQAVQIDGIRHLDTNERFNVYVKAFALFSAVLQARELTPHTKSRIAECDYHIVECCMRHLDARHKYKNKFPKFVNRLFKTFCGAQTQIRLSLHMLHSDYPGFANVLMSSKVPNLVAIHCWVRIFSQLKAILIYDALNLSDAYLHTLMAMLERMEGKNVALVNVKLHNVLYNHQCLDSQFLSTYSAQFRMRAHAKLTIDTKHRLIYNEHTKSYSEHVEQTDLVIVRNSSNATLPTLQKHHSLKHIKSVHSEKQLHPPRQHFRTSTDPYFGAANTSNADVHKSLGDYLEHYPAFIDLTASQKKAGFGKRHRSDAV